MSIRPMDPASPAAPLITTNVLACPARKRARLTGLMVLAPLLTLACAHLQVATVPRAPTLAASHERTQWITDRLRELRSAQRCGDRASERAARDQLAQAGVD